ncbi:MAG: tetratricopeptide repeat protein [Deltaproteobacteria bacterium]|nr:tetratricopeptide repeat protein [Deltaproteobacteria bacterium]
MDSDPGFGSAYVEYAQFLFKRKRFDEAQDVLEKLLSPGFRRPYTAPWVTIEKPRAETLLAKINMAR